MQCTELKERVQLTPLMTPYSLVADKRAHQISVGAAGLKTPSGFHLSVNVRLRGQRSAC